MSVALGTQLATRMSRIVFCGLPDCKIFFQVISHTVILPRKKIIESKKCVSEWRKLHNEELSDLYSLSNIVRVVKTRRMRWAGHVAHMGEGRGVHRVLVGKPE